MVKFIHIFLLSIIVSLIFIQLAQINTEASSSSSSHSHHHKKRINHGRKHQKLDDVQEKQTDKSLYTGATAIPVPEKPLNQLPDELDWCNIDGKSYCTASWNQHIPKYCGSCYVHGALAAVNDRIKLALAGKHDLLLSRQVILNCASKYGLGDGCNGGEGFDVFEYMHRFGLPDESCQNYVAEASEHCNAESICQNCMPIGEEIFPFKCWAVEKPILYYVESYGHVSGEAAMMSEIAARGPITCGFASVDDFDYNYRSGVYIDSTNATELNHDVEVVGWGVDENGTKYWKARNSWGTYWGENSFFKIIRGVNNMLFESDCTFAIVDTNNLQEVLAGKYGGSMYGIVADGEKALTDADVQGKTLLAEVAEVAEYAKENRAAAADYYKQYVADVKTAKSAQSVAAADYQASQAEYRKAYASMGDEYKSQGKSAGAEYKSMGKEYEAENKKLLAESQSDNSNSNKAPAAFKTNSLTDAAAIGGVNPDASRGDSYINQYAGAYAGGHGASDEKAHQGGKPESMPDLSGETPAAANAAQNYAPAGSKKRDSAAADPAAGYGYGAGGGADWQKYSNQYAGQYMNGAGGGAGAAGADDSDKGSDDHSSNIEAGSAASTKSIESGGAANRDAIKAGGDAASIWSPQAGTKDTYGYAKFMQPHPATDSNHPKAAKTHTNIDLAEATQETESLYAPAAASQYNYFQQQKQQKSGSAHHKKSHHSKTDSADSADSSNSQDYNQYINKYANGGGAGAGAGGAGGFNWQQYTNGAGSQPNQANQKNAKNKHSSHYSSVLADIDPSSGDSINGGEVNQEIRQSILDAYHRESTAVNRNHNQIEADRSRENAAIVTAIKHALDSGAEGARSIKISVHQAIAEIRAEAEAESASLDAQGRSIGSEAQQRFNDVYDETADAIEQIKREQREKEVELEAAAAAKVTEIGNEVKSSVSSGLQAGAALLNRAANKVSNSKQPQSMNLAELATASNTAESNSMILPIISAVLAGAMASAAIIFGCLRRQSYDEI